MSDRELLELAAKAAGLAIYWQRQAERDEDGQGDSGLWIVNGSTCWNPLRDDGDALRLAVKLKLLVDAGYCCAMATESIKDDWWGGGEDEHAGVAHDECDPFAATRRAIVRAAAEIGRQMEGRNG